MATKNLWGEIKDLPKIKSPVSILKEQSQLLEQLSGGLLIGTTKENQSSNPQELQFSFYINAPSLNNYSYKVLNFSHDIGLYPVYVIDANNAMYSQCKNVDEFESALGKIFSSPGIQRVITGLLSQIQTT